MSEHSFGDHLYARGSIWREASRGLRELARFRELIGYLLGTTLRKETTGRALGALWWVLDPLLLMIVYVVFVDVILNRGGENFALFVLTALLAFKHLSSACGTAMGATVGRENLMRQLQFPKAVLPLSAVLASTVHFLLGMGVLVLISLPFGVYPSIFLPIALLVLSVQLLLVLGFAFALAAVNFYFRDIQPLTSYVFRAWFYLSPGLYAVSAVPDRYRDVYELNPLAGLFTAYRDVFLDHRLPDFGTLGIIVAAGTVFLALAYVLFVRLEHSFTKVA